MIAWLLKTRAALYTALILVAAAAWKLFIARVKRQARNDLKKDMKLKDYEHAQDIKDRVDDALSDPEQRLRDYDGRGYRDGEDPL